MTVSRTMRDQVNPIEWIGVDWGTTNLRVFAVNNSGTILDKNSSADGMAKLSPDAFEAALLDLIEPWLVTGHQTPVLACGMVGARQGWRETPYRTVPCSPLAFDDLTLVPTNDARIKVHILPGLSQTSPADVMRGEETQIAGFLAQHPTYSGAICLPGTHSKWALISYGEVKHFTTYMTGEMFDVIANQTILKHSVSSETWDEATLLEAALHAAKDPKSVSEELFGLRALLLLENASPEQLRSRLSGLLIGQELGLANRIWQDQPVCIIGSKTTSPIYHKVLQRLGCTVTAIDPTKASFAGLATVASHIKENQNA